MKYSIIIVAYKDRESLVRCLASIRESGITDHQVILVDNSPKNIGLAGLDVDLFIRPGGNIGFAAACNLGARDARGDLLIFLNPDTIVEYGWADKMSEGIQGTTVAVGPLSDYVAGRQQIALYGGEGEGFLETKLLIGFCLMIKRAVFEEVGGMDADLFLGCDDLDLSWRLQRKGWKMAIALGVFVHHEGHTSMRLNPEKDRLIGESEDKFRAKLEAYYAQWREVPSSEELWDCRILPTVVRPQTLSVCIIYRDDLKQLFQLMGSLTFADEIVICDTSPDLEVQSFDDADRVLKRFTVVSGMGNLVPGITIYKDRFPWCDDFAAARNHALSRCTKDWVLWLDTDDEVPAHSAAQIRALLDKPGRLTALQACHFGFTIENVGRTPSETSVFQQGRLFPRLPEIRWGGLGGCLGKVHESYTEAAARAGLAFVPTDIRIRHHGYADPDEVVRKQVRNLKLLELEPPCAVKLYNMGCALYALKSQVAAEAIFREALNYPGEDVHFYDTVRYLIAIICTQTGRWAEVADLIQGSRKADAVFLAGKYCLWAGNPQEAAAHFRRYLKLGEISDPLGSNYPAFREEAAAWLKEHLEPLEDLEDQG